MNLRSLLLCLLVVPTLPLCAQAPEPPSPIQIQSLDIQRAKLPNGKADWTKIICKFTNSKDWTDGISFNFSVLVQISGGSNYRVLTGGLSYMNVPKGASDAILYLSPNATARFGTPFAASVDVYRGDRALQTFQWKSNSASVDPEWLTKYPSFAGGLLTVRSTPWILTDTESTPDLISN